MTAEWLNKSMPEREKIMAGYISEGAAALAEGHGLSACPYRPDSQEAAWWRRGFGNAKLGTLIGGK